MKPCLDCGEPTTRTRCVLCARAYDRNRRPSGGKRYPASWQKARSRMLATADSCRVCGKPGTAGDPLTGGHNVPRVYGGTERDGLGPEHRSCNSAKGARFVADPAAVTRGFDLMTGGARAFEDER